jgi:ABC-type multidrug transport system fused ATPase/permease subunit
MLEGRIAERGSHQQLLAQGGWYARMFTLQQDEVDATLA